MRACDLVMNGCEGSVWIGDVTGVNQNDKSTLDDQSVLPSCSKPIVSEYEHPDFILNICGWSLR